MVFDGYDYMVVSYTMPQISAEWALNKVQTGSLSSWSLFGLIIGGMFAGIISDKIGRRKTLICSIATYSLLTIPIYFSTSFAQFAFFRVLAGVGLGACIPVVTTIFSESTPTARRALFITFGMAWMIVGWVLGGLIPTLLVPHHGWRVCYLIGGFPFLYAVFLYFRMNESAYWLANKGRKKEAVAILAYIERQATGKATPRDPNALIVPPAPKVVGPRALFSKDYRMITAGLWITYFCGCFTVYGLNAWLPSLMLEKGFKLASAYSLAIANNSAAVIANCTTGFVSEIVGRRPNLILSYLLGWFFHHPDGFRRRRFCYYPGCQYLHGFRHQLCDHGRAAADGRRLSHRVSQYGRFLVPGVWPRRRSSGSHCVGNRDGDADWIAGVVSVLCNPVCYRRPGGLPVHQERDQRQIAR